MAALKRTICMAMSLCILLTLCLGINAHAVSKEPKYYDQASALYELGLFKGTGTNADGTPIFALEQNASRIQGLVMLIRLLGEEQDALAYTGACPFTDVPAWAQKYAGYAFAKGYTKGTTATTFGADDALLGRAYLTFVLRALGYSDANGDFSYNDANTFAVSLGLIAEGQCEGNLLRDDCAMVSHSALRQKMKGTDTKLAEKLVADGVLTADAVQAAGVLNGKIAVVWDNQKKQLKLSDIVAAIPDAYCVSVGGNRGNWTYNSVPWDTDEVRLVLLASYSGASDYVHGKATKISESKYDLWNLSPNSNFYYIITVLNKSYEMIAYGILPLKYADEMIYLTPCQIGGKETLDGLKKAANNVKILTGEIFYKEYVTTIHPDGTEETKAYLRMDQSKMPDSLKDAVYYKYGGSSNKKELLEMMFTLNNYVPDTDENAKLRKIGEEHELYIKAHYSDSWYMSFYDANKTMIACVKQGKDITANEVKTVIDLRENASQPEN